MVAQNLDSATVPGVCILVCTLARYYVGKRPLHRHGVDDVRLIAFETGLASVPPDVPLAASPLWEQGVVASNPTAPTRRFATPRGARPCAPLRFGVKSLGPILPYNA
jgi:hypothetical protein